MLNHEILPQPEHLAWKGPRLTSREKKTASVVARNMHGVRKHQELSQKDVAKALCITQSTLSKMEHGKLIPSAVQWHDFCRLTGLAMDSLLSTTSVGKNSKSKRRA